MERNVILAVVLSLLVLVTYNVLITRFVERPSAPKKKQVIKEEKQDKMSEMGKKPERPVSLPLIHSKEKGNGIEEKMIEVETPLFKGTITNQGSGIKVWKLKSYRDGLEKDSPTVQVLSPNSSGRYPFEVLILDPLTGLEERPILSPDKESLSVEMGEKGELILSGVTSDGLNIQERLTFSFDSYSVDMEIKIFNGSDRSFKKLLTANLIGPVTSGDRTRWTGHTGPVSYIDGKVKRERAKKIIARGNDYQGNILWTSMEKKYFAASLIPVISKNARLLINSPSQGIILSRFITQQDALSPQETRSYGFRLYLGPKEIDILKGMGGHMEEIINLGVFAFIARPLFIVLKFFYSYLSNYGLAIILLTTLIKIFFYPLSRHSLKSMQEMRKLQPQMAAIKKKYKDNKEKTNKEIMALYKRNKVNPLGGCLPMILQIPVFISLYKVLLTSIELRHAPFILWITDLSQPDRLGSFPIPYVTPQGIPVLTLLMGASMFLQQKMSPTAVDPQQAKIMLLMPIFFTFMFLNFPSGLVLYWLVNNILQIGQQYVIQKKT